MKIQLFILSIFLFSIFITVQEGYAKIPEPDNIVYGVAREDAAVTALKINSVTIASYTQGENPDADDYYILRVPIDSFDPQEPDTARPGDIGYIYINSETDPAATVTIGERGTIQIVHLSQKDSDHDGVIDALDQCPDTPSDEQADEYGCSSSQRDEDGDGVSDDKDLCPDTPSNEQADENGCSSSQDGDGDGVPDDKDLCPDTPSNEQADENGCSSSQDGDGDGVTNAEDNCPYVPNPDQADSEEFSTDTLWGSGTAVIDGVISVGEWDNANQIDFSVDLPEGGTAPATLLNMNDGNNLYIALKFQRNAADPGNSFRIEFDNNGDGVQEIGDDSIVLDATTGFSDNFWSNEPPCPTDEWCSFSDADYEGTKDGSGDFQNDGTFSIYEIAHPFDSADDLHDFSLTSGQIINFYLSLRIEDESQLIVNTRFPNTGYEVIGITPAGDGVGDACDNCIDHYNPYQTDTDEDGIGDVCDEQLGDINGSEIIDIDDVFCLFKYIMGRSSCLDNVNVPSAAYCDVKKSGNVDIDDVFCLFKHIIGRPSCMDDI